LVKIKFDAPTVVSKRGLATSCAAWLFAIGCLLGASSASSQQVQVQVGRGPYYVGESFEIQVTASDFAKDPAPVIELGESVGGRLRHVGTSPSSSTSISIVNGKMTRTREVKFVYHYEFTGIREGLARVPEFTVTQGTLSRTTRRFDFEIEGVPITDWASVKVELPEGPIFVGQKIPIAIEFRVDRQTQRALVSYQVHVPLFDSPTLRFLDEPPPRSDTQLEIETQAGTIRLPATSTEGDMHGRKALIVRAERIMIATSPERIRADAPTVFISQGANFRRDVFGQRRATTTEKFMSTGRLVDIEVAEVPRTGRPESFAGAVGSGFSLEVEADRSVVQLGEPITLTFHLRGDGDLSSASLPPLGAEGLFDSTRFRLPADSPAGIVDEEGKHFRTTLRVLDAGVREIPALEYAWFDADSRRFETTRSRPIALSVGAAEIVGAAAVARNETAETERPADESRVPGPDEDARSGSPLSTSLSQSGANLAVERDLAKLLLNDRGQQQNLALVASGYGLGLAFLGLAFFFMRRDAEDPRVVRRKEAFDRTERAIANAFAPSGSGDVAALGRGLRELIAELPEEAGAEIDLLIAECDAMRFAPASEGRAHQADGKAGSLRERAEQWIAERKNAESVNRGVT
jgi:hypothetical protein